MGIPNLFQNRPGPPSTEGLNQPYVHPSHRHGLGPRYSARMTGDSGVCTRQCSKLLEGESCCPFDDELTFNRRPKRSHLRNWVCTIRTMMECTMVQLPGHLDWTQSPTTCNSGRTSTRMGSLLAKGLWVCFGDGQIEDAAPTAFTSKEGDLHAPSRGQFNFSHCPPSATQRALAWKYGSSRAQRVAPNGQARQLLHVESTTLPGRPNASLTRTFPFTQLQVQSVRPRVSQPDVLILHHALIGSSRSVSNLL